MLARIDRIKQLAKSKGISITYVCEKIGMGRGYLNDIVKSNGGNIPDNRLKIIADTLNTTVEYLTGLSDSPSKVVEASIILDNSSAMIPLYESVSAGFGAIADDSIIDYIPCYVSNVSDISNYLCVRVVGNSMYPKIENGDIIQVHKQNFAENGNIVVALIDGDNAIVKKIIYSDDAVELVSENPLYPSIRYTGEAMSNVHILGVVKTIIKEV